MARLICQTSINYLDEAYTLPLLANHVRLFAIMKLSSQRFRPLTFTAVLLLTTALLSLTRLGIQAIPQSTLSRPTEPITVSGFELSDLLGSPIAELRLYHYGAAGWQPIPFQVDELTTGGVFTTTEDGLLDSNDQLTFMSHDAGFVASQLWVADAQAQSHPRIELCLNDPLNGDSGAAYLYRSPTLAESDQAYVSWDEPSQTLTAEAYSAGFEPADFLGLAYLQLAGQTQDMLDRQKLRVDLQISPPPPFPPFSQQLTEEDLADQFNIPTTITLPISGPVRALGGGENQQLAFYGWQFDSAFALDVADVVTNFSTIHVESLRSSRDWLDPIAAGYGPAAYFDSNVAAGVTVDGSPDNVMNLPPPTWQELSTAAGNIVALATIAPGQGSYRGYYLDDSVFNGNDTGDGRSYGDFGYVISEPNGVITVTETILIRPAGPSQGAAALDAAVQPILVMSSGQNYAPANSIYLPVVSRP